MTKKLTESQMDHIWKNNLYSTLDANQKKQLDIYLFGEEFMESENKGSLQTYEEK